MRPAHATWAFTGCKKWCGYNLATCDADTQIDVVQAARRKWTQAGGEKAAAIMLISIAERGHWLHKLDIDAALCAPERR